MLIQYIKIVFKLNKSLNLFSIIIRNNILNFLPGEAALLFLKLKEMGPEMSFETQMNEMNETILVQNGY